MNWDERIMMDRNTTFKHWFVCAQMAGWQLQEFTRPSFIGRHEVPQDLNHLTIGQLMQLGMLSGDGMIYGVCRIIMGLEEDEVNKARAIDVVRFAGWVMGEVRRINKLFEKTNVRPTPQQVRAGIGNLRFGLFGVLDWYALRMGYQDHEKVADVPWLNIYKCMDMDAKKILFERKLQEVINNDNRRQSARNRR